MFQGLSARDFIQACLGAVVLVVFTYLLSVVFCPWHNNSFNSITIHICWAIFKINTISSLNSRQTLFFFLQPTCYL